MIADTGSLEEYLLAQEKKHASAKVLVGEIEKKRALVQEHGLFSNQRTNIPSLRVLVAV